MYFTLYTDLDLIDKYIDIEQKNTSFNLKNKIQLISSIHKNDILVDINGKNFTQDDFIYIQQLTEILDDSGEVGEFEIGNLKLTVHQIKTYEKELIVCKTY